ncbi:MAG: hypothetical protein LBF22_11970 [Deltaproteobacteria bacterium]|jgi:hypothetical protein|nr:hypothetical protein [Deltaproteobacteria bacterium]
MRKIIALVLGTLLITISIPSMASSPIEFEGYVKVYHETLSNFSRGPQHGGINLDGFIDRDNFFENKLQITVTFRPQDNVAIVWQFRGPNYQRWGVTGAATPRGLSDRDVVNLYTRAVYGEVTFPWGTIRGGRILEGAPGMNAGLATLGYSPTWGSEFLYLNPFDISDPMDALLYTNSWDNGFYLGLYYSKYVSYWGMETSNYSHNNSRFSHGGYKDNDMDAFGIEASYSWENGGVGLAVDYTRDMSDPRAEKANYIQINPSAIQAWGPFAIHFEAVLGWGKRTLNRYFSGILDDQSNEFYAGGFGFYLDGVYTYDSGDLTLAGWYTSGTELERTSNGNYVVSRRDHILALLGDFAPFLVAYNGVTLGNGYASNSFDWFGYDQENPVANPPSYLTNHWALAFLGNHEITPEIKLNYGIGYFRLVNPNYAVLKNNGQFTLQSKDLGWELDIGATFQILDSVSFETQFGYFFNGSAFDYYDRDYDIWRSARDTFAWANVLTFNF